MAAVVYIISSLLHTVRKEKEKEEKEEKKEKDEKEEGARDVLVLLVVSVVISSAVCIGVSRCLPFCSSYAGDHLKCLIDNSIIADWPLQLLLNPAHFPLTISAVIPVMVSLAVNQTLFKTSKTEQFKRKLGWMLFISIYSLFLCDLIIYSQSAAIVHNILVVLSPLHWRFPIGSLIRNGAVLATALIQE